MNLTHLTHYDLFDPNLLSGTPYWILKSPDNVGAKIQPFYIKPEQQLLPP